MQENFKKSDSDNLTHGKTTKNDKVEYSYCDTDTNDPLNTDSTIYVENFNINHSNLSGHTSFDSHFQSDRPLYINRLGDSREFGNFYDVVQERKERILAFLQKDVLQITNPDLRSFVDVKHAYESLIPYHLFSKGLYEDQVFNNTDILPEIDYKECLDCFDDILDLYDRPLVEQHGLVSELLLFYEQRYIKGSQAKEKPSVKRKSILNKRNTVIRLRVEDRGCENGIRVNNYKFYINLPKDISI